MYLNYIIKQCFCWHK